MCWVWLQYLIPKPSEKNEMKIDLEEFLLIIIMNKNYVQEYEWAPSWWKTSEYEATPISMQIKPVCDRVTGE